MRAISSRVRKVIDTDKYYKTCARWRDGGCSYHITMEHALIYGGNQIDEVWAIIPLCTYHHAVNEYQDGGDLDKNKNVWIALNRASDEELLKYSRRDFISERSKLNKIYGKYDTGKI